MPKLMNYLSFDNANKAIKYYEEVFSAKVLGKINMTQEQLDMYKIDKKPEDTVMHASMSILGNTINCSDNMMGTSTFTNAMSLLLDFNSEDDIEMQKLEELYALVSTHKDTKILMPLDDQFWGGKMGMVTDAYGIQWMFHAQPYSKIEGFSEMN